MKPTSQARDNSTNSRRNTQPNTSTHPRTVQQPLPRTYEQQTTQSTHSNNQKTQSNPPTSHEQPSIPTQQETTIQRPRQQVLDSTANPKSNPQGPTYTTPDQSSSNATNTAFGDKMINPKPTHTLRLYAQNMNGIQLQPTGGDIPEICDHIIEHSIDNIGLIEHNLDQTKPSVTSALQKELRSPLTQTKLTIAGTNIQMAKTYKPGGTISLTIGTTVGRIITTHSDPLGRWSYHSYHGKDHKRVVIIHAYQTPKSTLRPGRVTAAAQQHSLLLQQGHPHPDPRDHFIRDFRSLLRDLRATNHSIIALGDFNENIHHRNSKIADICHELHLVDIHKHRHPQQESPHTYIRGSNCIDYALCTRDILPAIRHSGYLPFNHHLISDHRAMFLDIDTRVLFGHELNSIPPATLRRLRSTSPKQVTQYLHTKYKLFLRRNIFDRIHKLTEATQPDHHLAEQLDRDLTNLSLAAEKKLPTFKTPSWTPQLKHSRISVGIYKRHLSVLRHGKDQSQPISRLQQSLPDPITLPATIQEAQIQLRQAQRRLRKILKDSHQERQQVLDQWKIECSLQGQQFPTQKQRSLILTRIQKAEQKQQMFAKLRNLQKSNHKEGLTSLQIPINPLDNPKTCTQWHTVTDPSQIAHHLIQRNQQHFGQAQGTPFTVHPISTAVDFRASTSTTEMILAGDYHPSEVDTVTQQVIKQLQKIPTHSTIKTTITSQAFRHKLRVWKESTTTSPSGLHLGHWKSLVTSHEHSRAPPDDESRLRLDAIQHSLLEAHLALLNYSLRWGYLFHRWQNVTNVMIQKEPGNNKIHRLRVLHLYEADYNLLLSLKWRELLHHSEDHRLLHHGQFGSRPHRSAPDLVFLEEIMTEISRITRKSLIRFDNDASACYDRIIPAVAAITSRKYGMPAPVVEVMTKTLENASYRLKTPLGISTQSYQHSNTHPIYGSGQGAGNSPTLWALISSTLYDCHEAQAYGATFSNPTKTLQTKFTIEGFVDDSNEQVNEFDSNKQPSPTKLIRRMQHDAQLWNDLLWSSGGALELSKCSYHLLHWNFSLSGAPLLQDLSHTEHPPLSIQTARRDQGYIIPYRNPYQAHKTLGHYKEPAGTQRAQFRHLLEKTTTMARFLRHSPINSRETRLFYTTIYLPRMTYPMKNTFFTKPQLEQLQRQALGVTIQKLGFNKCTARVIIHGSTQYGGAQLPHLYTEQGIGQLTQFLRHWRTPQSRVGRTLRILVHWTQQSLGLATSFLTDTTTPLPHMETKWLTSLRNFLATTGGFLQLDDPGLLPLQREHDQHIMEIILRSKRFTDQEIRYLNYCRLYLQAVTISDLSLPNGTHLDGHMLRGNLHFSSSFSRLLHINQDRPSNHIWNLWRRANRLWSTPNGLLKQKLGKWLLSPHEQRRQWTWYYDSRQHTLWQKHKMALPQQYVEHFTDSHHTCPHVPSLQVTSFKHISAQAEPIRPTFTRSQIHLTVTPHKVPPPSPLPATQTIQQQLQPKIPLYNHWYHPQHFHLTSVPQLMHSALHGELFTASDGSAPTATHGSYGFVIADRSQTFSTGSGPVHGATTTSFRAEIYGIIAVVQLLNAIPQSSSHPPWKITHYCDNKSAILYATTFLRPDQPGTPPPQATIKYHPLCTDWDALRELQHHLQHSPHQWTFLHVKSHQDEHTDKPLEELPLRAQLNIQADRLAGTYHPSQGQQNTHQVSSLSGFTKVPLMQHSGALLHLPAGTITRHYKRYLRQSVHDPPLRNHLQQRHGWTDTEFLSINWEAFQQAFRKATIPQTHLIKLTHSILPTQSRLHLYDPAISPNCPHCAASLPEDYLHILQCPHPAYLKWRRKFLQKLRHHCDQKNTNPTLRDLLIEGLESWMAQRPPRHVTDSTKYNALVHEQNQIGWYYIIHGWFSNQWVAHQQEYTSQLQHTNLADTSKSPTAQHWQTSLQQIIWHHWHLLWKLRNELLHGTAPTTSPPEHLVRTTHQTLHTIYNNRHHYTPQEQELLYPTVHEHLQNHTFSSIRNWIATYLPVFQAGSTPRHPASIAHTRPITTYFPSHPPSLTTLAAHSRTKHAG